MQKMHFMSLLTALVHRGIDSASPWNSTLGLEHHSYILDIPAFGILMRMVVEEQSTV